MNIPIYLMEQQLQRFMKKEPEYHKLEQLINKNQDEPLKHLKVDPKANLQPVPEDLFERTVDPTPILVLYIDIREITKEELPDALLYLSNSMDKYRTDGWSHIIIPVKSETRLEVAAIEGSYDKTDFETFKKQILEEINGSKSTDIK